MTTALCRTELPALPISKLPPELLCIIFFHASRAYDKFLFRYDPETNVQFLISMSHVCREWREIIIESPILWSCIDFDSPNLLDLCLLRCKTAPLSIRGRITVQAQSSINFVSLFSKHWHHIQHIQVRFDPEPFEALAPLLEMSSTPLLETLNLNVDAPFSKSFFRGETPRLKRLELTSLDLTWTPPPFACTGISHLVLSCISRPHLDELLRMLETTPNLISFLVEHSLPLPLPQSSYLPPHGVVHLEKLETFELNDDLSSISYVLAHVSFPRNTRLTISAEAVDDDITPLFNPFIHFVSDTSPIRSLYVAYHHDTISIYSAPQEVVLTNSRWDRHSYQCNFNSDHEDYWSPSVASLRTFCSQLILTHVTSLFCHSTVESDGFWFELFSRMQNLRYVCINGALLEHFINVLPCDASDERLRVQYPLLEALMIFVYAPDQERAARIADAFQRLSIVLKAREAHLPLKQLYVEGRQMWVPRRVQESMQLLERDLPSCQIIGRDNHTGSIWFRASSVSGQDGTKKTDA